MNSLERLLYDVSGLFLIPVLVVLCAMFVYALFALGAFLLELALRTAGRAGPGPLSRHARAHPQAGQEALELRVLRLLEPLRIVSRVAPMLGLVATMIPMGPALVAVAAGNAKGMAENLVVAFSAVVIALLAAAMAFTTLSVRRRWLLMELHELLPPTSGGEARHG